MNRPFLLFITLLLLAGPEKALPAEGTGPSASEDRNVRGRVESVDADRKKALVVIDGSRFEVSLAALEPESRAALLANAGTAGEVQIQPRDALVLVGDDTGVTNTACREKKLSSEELFSTVAGAKSQDEFLLALGESLPQATFVYESRSLQKDRVSRDNPRVVRFSADGKQVVTYVCDPRSKDYGTIEMMTWNESTSNYDFAHVSFQGRGKRASSHVERNPESCTACHGSGDSAKPIWGHYPDWPGTYGADDDLLGAPGSRDYESFQKFQERYKDSPCLSTLPKARAGSSKEKVYPYISIRRDLNFSLRPNSRLSMQLSGNYSETVYEKIRRDPLWPVMQYYVFAEFLECGLRYPWSRAEKSVQERAARWLPALSGASSASMETESGNRLLTRFSVARGIDPGEWNLDLTPTAGRAPDLKYNTGAGTMQNWVIGRAMADADQDPQSGLQGAFSALGRGSAYGGAILGCEEPTFNAGLVLGDVDKACKAVMAKLDELDRRPVEGCPAPEVAGPIRNAEPLLVVAAGLSKDANEGRLILERRCAECHGGSGSLGFLSSEETFRGHVQGGGRFSSREVLDAIRSGYMPMEGAALSRSEQEKVSAYIESLKSVP